MAYTKPEIHPSAVALEAIQGTSKEQPPQDGHPISETTVNAYEADE